ncbi:type VI secretion system tip protein TssI/VgrG [Polyangium sp. y55x31]|uniref:type VI secretion system Vgr family protein n=1 Tax=Polyangium sp. y55x31 TaxID=3042688 RepID=UPI0024829C39|nr:type VI secretion system tip protein TssI/VgrG [Polyangium sp. y55x31]MDI1476374.1 type VI secretion system tip protein TssI/VgrG [Polyangium sp. y55x31]
MRDLITFSSSGLPRPSRVVGFRGTEAVSRPYRFEVYLQFHSDDGDIDFAEAVGDPASLVIDRESDDIPPYVLAGVLGDVDLVHEHGGRALVRVVLVPRFARLALSRHSRIFTKKSAPDAIRAVLDDNGLAGSYEFRLTQGYEVEEHIGQYRESDFDFVSRWLEREGIYYFFEHNEGGEKIVFCDDKSYPAEGIGKPVRYFPQTGEDRSAGASFRSFSLNHGSMPAEVKLRDYDYARPKLDISGSAAVSAKGAGKVSLYGERFFSPDTGARLAKIRSEEFLTRKSIARATGTRMHLRAGYTFDLEEHPRPRFNTKYLAIEVHHQGNQAAGDVHLKEIIGLEHDDTYYVEVAAIPASTQFRPESRTSWPRIYGFENGVVDGGGESEYAQIDEYGRYLVKFNFDENDSPSGSGSTYVRMMQPHGGSIEGFHFPLRKGTEVVLSFLGGDPDRPVISGVVPNVLNPSPVSSGNHTKNIIQTGGRNRLELEDLAGSQRVTLSTPYSNSYIRMGSPNDGHEFIAKTDDNGLLGIGKNFDTNVGQNWNITVAENMEAKVEGDIEMTAVGDAKCESENKVEIEHSNKLSITGGATMDIKGGITSEFFGGWKQELLLGAKTEQLIGVKQATHFALVHEVFLGAKIEFIKGKKIETLKGPKTETHIGDTKSTHTGKETSLHTGNANSRHIGNLDEFQQGNAKSVLHGNLQETHRGNATTSHYGNAKDTHIGNLTETHRGNLTATSTGFVRETHNGAVVSKINGQVLEIFNGPFAEVKIKALERHEANVRLSKMRTDIQNEANTLLRTGRFVVL